VLEPLRYGASTNVVDSKLNTPLHDACGYGSFGAAVLLVGHGADRTRRNAKGESARDVACTYFNDATAVRALLSLLDNF